MEAPAICNVDLKVMNIVKVFEKWGHEEKYTALDRPFSDDQLRESP